MNSRNRSYAIYILLFLAMISMVYFNMQQQALETRVIPINQLAADIEAGKVSKVTAVENNLTIAYKDGTNKESTLDPQSGLVEQLYQLGVSSKQLQDPGLELINSKRDVGKGAQYPGLHPPLCFYAGNILVLHAPGTGLKQRRDGVFKVPRAFDVWRTPDRHLC